MVHFEISRVGFNCGRDKTECSHYPDHCKDCLKKQIQKLGMEISPKFKILEADSEEKRLQMVREHLWQKFLDVLNIKHVLLIDKKSGIPIVDYPISGAGVDIGLLTGFIQANITFSESGEIPQDQSQITIDKHFYEFRYKNFQIILKQGGFVRLCLVLDQTASETLKARINDFLIQYELRYMNKLQKLYKSGQTDFGDTIDFITDFFNVTWVFPMELSKTIPPNVLNQLEDDPMKHAIFKLAKEFMGQKKFFFINHLINELHELADVEADVLLHEIYQMLEQEIIVPKSLEKAADELRQFKENRAARIADNELISSLISGEESEIDTLKQQVETMDEDEAKDLMKVYVKKGKKAEKALIYKEAQKEFEKALYIATGFNFEKDIGKISFMILELDKKIKKMEYDFSISAAEKAEKNDDYLNSIRNYQKAISILENDMDFEKADSLIKKLNKRIKKLQSNL